MVTLLVKWCVKTKS